MLGFFQTAYCPVTVLTTVETMSATWAVLFDAISTAIWSGFPLIHFNLAMMATFWVLNLLGSLQ